MTTRQNREIEDLNNTINLQDLTAIYRTLRAIAEYTFFSSTHGTFSRRDQMLGHKMSLGKCKRIKITQTMLRATME